MAAEYGALLKWPKDKVDDLNQCKGKPSILELRLFKKDETSIDFTIHLDDKWGFDECYEKCFQYIKPMVAEGIYLRGEILSLNLSENIN
jgi:hypothetical protein